MHSIFTKIFVLSLSLYLLQNPFSHVLADWDCVTTAGGSKECVEQPTASTYRTLRDCLTNNTPDDTSNDICKTDPRYVMRNFAALNFWSVGRLVNLAVPLTIAFGAGVCLLFMLFGAYSYVMSGGEEKKITDATHTMTYAAVGLIVIVLAYTIVRTVLFATKINTFGF